MARARILKPGFFANEQLADVSFAARLLFAGLWTLADREGRLEYRPRRIRGALFAYDNVDVAAEVDALRAAGLVCVYSDGGSEYLHIPSFLRHQHPHHREPASEIPPCSAHPCEKAEACAPSIDTGPGTSPRPALGQPGAKPGLVQGQPGASPRPAYGTPQSGRADPDPVIDPDPDPVPDPGTVAREPSLDLDVPEPAAKPDIVGQVVDEIVALGFPAPNRLQLEDLAAELHDFGTPLSWLTSAFRAARDAGKPSWQYASAILRRYAEQGGPDPPRAQRARNGTAPPADDAAVWDEWAAALPPPQEVTA